MQHFSTATPTVALFNRHLQFNLEDPPYTVTVKAKSAKNKKKGTLVLHESMIDDLRKHFEPLKPSDKAFPGMWKRRGAEMLAIDLKAAGIPYVDGLGLKADFHALRHTFGSMMNGARIPLPTAQKLMRHSDPKLTANIYTHVQLQEAAAAIAQLPSIKAQSGEQKVVSDEADSRKSESHDTAKCTVSADGYSHFTGLIETRDVRESGSGRQVKNPGSACEASKSRVFKNGAGEALR